MPCPSLPAEKRLLLISNHNSYRIAPYIKAATRLGLSVTIASEGKHSLVTEVANGLHLDFNAPDEAVKQIVEQHNREAFSGILGSDDQTVALAARAAEALSLPHNPPQAAQCTQRKDLARASLSLAGCPVPLNCLLDLSLPVEKQMAGLPWPCVLKPLAMSASRGVIRADNEQQFLDACQTLRPILASAANEFEQSHILIEAYIDGIEIAYEGYLDNGKLHTITVFDKPDPLVGPYFEETIYVTPSSLNDKLLAKLEDILQKACDAYQLRTGPVHAECRIDRDNNIWILEIASRTIGGDCARVLDSENFNIEELAILLATGQPVSVSQPDYARGVMMIPVRQKGLLKRVEGLLAARNTEHIDKVDIIIRQGHELIPLPEGNQYLGYIFAHAETTDKVVAAIRQAYAQLNFVTSPIFKIS